MDPNEPQDDSHRPPGDESEDFDLSDLEAEGVDGVLDRLRGPAPEDADASGALPEGEGPDDDIDPASFRRVRPGRSPVLSIVVIALGLGLLGWMFKDARYALQGSEPHTIEDVGALFEAGDPDIAERYVSLHGTPDVQHAAQNNKVWFYRITEAGSSLFVVVPRDENAGKYLQTYHGNFEGRARRLSDTRLLTMVQLFFDSQGLSREAKATADALRAALASGGLTSIETADGTLEVAPDDQVYVVVEQPDARVQLGRDDFKRKSEAEAAVAALGYPWIRLDRRGDFHSFLVRIPPDRYEEAQSKLAQAAPEGGGGFSVRGRRGVAVLPRTATYTAPAESFRLEGDALTFSYAGNTTSPGYRVDGEGAQARLVEREISGDGALSVPAAKVASAGVKRPLRVDPNGYVVLVGHLPSEQYTTVILWLVVLGLVGVNVFSLAVKWRRRRS